MRVEALPHDCLEELRPFLSRFGEQSLPSETVEVNVLRDGDEIVGAVMAERVVHIGPFYLNADKLGGTGGALLIRSALQWAEGTEAHVVAMNPDTEEMCKRFGLVHVDGSLWIKENA